MSPSRRNVVERKAVVAILVAFVFELECLAFFFMLSRFNCVCTLVVVPIEKAMVSICLGPYVLAV